MGSLKHLQRMGAVAGTWMLNPLATQLHSCWAQTGFSAIYRQLGCRAKGSSPLSERKEGAV